MYKENSYYRQYDIGTIQNFSLRFITFISFLDLVQCIAKQHVPLLCRVDSIFNNNNCVKLDVSVCLVGVHAPTAHALYFSSSNILFMDHESCIKCVENRKIFIPF